MCICPQARLFTYRKQQLHINRQTIVICRNDWITQNSEFFVATIYHPPDYEYNEQDLIEFLIDSCEQLLLSKPNSNIIIAGDINNLNIRSVLNQLPFTQLVKTPTRGLKILDVFITNVPNYWKFVKVVKSLHCEIRP